MFNRLPINTVVFWHTHIYYTLQYMTFETLRAKRFLTVFFWVMTSPIKIHSVATQNTKIQMSNIWHFHFLFINLTEHYDLILYVHQRVSQRGSMSLPSSGISYKNFIWFAQKSLNLDSVFGIVTWTWDKESRCGSIPNTAKRFFSSAKCPHWFFGQSSFLFKGHQG